MSMRAAAIAWRHAQHAAVCDRSERWEHGTAVFAGDAPAFWTYNSVRLEGPDAGLAPDAIVAAADRLQAELGHRHVEIEDEATGARVRPALVERGWAAERLVWMALQGPAHAGTPAVEIGEIPFRMTRPLREQWAGASSGSAEEARRFMAAEDRVGVRRGVRALGAWGSGGELLGFAAFSAMIDTAEIEQVFVAPERRGTGIGGALVAAAVDAAAAQTTFIVADDEGAAKRLYARLGFAPVWIQHVFTRPPGCQPRQS